MTMEMKLRVDFGELKLLEFNKNIWPMSLCFPGYRTNAAAELCVSGSGEQPTWFSPVSVKARAQKQPWSG